jgi:hypothetical protein
MKCPDCDGKVKFQQANCQDCGRSLHDLDFERLQRETNQKKKKVIIASSLAILLLVGGVATKGVIDDRREKQLAIELAEIARVEAKAAIEAERAERARELAERNDYSWVPSGFTKFSVNNNMAYKTISYDAADCYSQCWGFLAISRDYCSSIRIEANITRKDVILDSSSDSESNIPAQTRVIMKITSSADLPWSASVTEATCT